MVVDGVIFHIPMLKTDGLYILCFCERQSRLPLAKDDVDKIALKMGYKLESESIQKEVEHIEISKRGTEYKKAEGVGISYCRKIDEAY